MVGPLAPLLHPEEHVLAQALELGQFLPQLLGGGGVAVLVHPFGRFPEFGRDLVFLLLRHNQLELLLVKLVLDKEERSDLLIKRGSETCHAARGVRGAHLRLKNESFQTVESLFPLLFGHVPVG